MAVYPFVVTRSLRLESGGKKFFFVHGYDLEVATGSMTVENYEKFAMHMCFNTNLVDKMAIKSYGMLLEISVISEPGFKWPSARRIRGAS